MNAVSPHFPILQVIIPLIGAFLTAFLRRGSSAFALTLIVSWIMPAIAGALLCALYTLSDGSMVTLWESWDLAAPLFPRTGSGAWIVGETGNLDLDAIDGELFALDAALSDYGYP